MEKREVESKAREEEASQQAKARGKRKKEKQMEKNRGIRAGQGKQTPRSTSHKQVRHVVSVWHGQGFVPVRAV